LETETPILFSDYQLMGHNGKRGVKDILIQTSSENNNPIVILLLSFSFFGVSEVHCFKEWNYTKQGTIKHQTYYCLGIK
jgi:hypothetical protein